MTVRRDEGLGLDRGSTAVIVPVTAPVDLLYRCIRSLSAHTRGDCPVLIVGPNPIDPALERFLNELDFPFRYRSLDGPTTPAQLANAGFDSTAQADVVLLASHATVPAGWLERLEDAGRSDTTVGTASALGNNAGLLSVQGPYEPLPQDASIELLAAEVADRSLRSRPRVPSADGHCVWISRAALELVGPFEDSFRSLRSALIDFSQRCLLQGQLNVVADDLFVPSVLPGLTAHAGLLPTGEDQELLERRYPYLSRALTEPASPPLSRSLSAARRSLRRLSVTIDARILRSSVSGAQAETLELIEALNRTEQVDVRVLLDPAVGGDSLSALDRLPSVERLHVGAATSESVRSDVVHRPFQVTSAEDLELLAQLGERVVITHLDLIAFHNPGYFDSFEAWAQHRRVTRQALALADQVIFLSQHAAHDAIREELVDSDRARVIPMAINRGSAATLEERPPTAPEREFLLCIGNDFRHKNRVFAVKLLAELRERGWEGELVLAGAHIGHGASRGEEARLLASRPELSAAIWNLPAVSEAQKAWLYARAAAVVYPTAYEGFGLVPFEAAVAGTPCLFAAQASLAEVLPPEAAVLVPWDAAESAERAMPLLRDGEPRRRHIEQVTETAAKMNDWESMGGALLETYEQAVRLPAREAAVLAADAQPREAELGKWMGLHESLGDLVGPEAYLPPDVQRALLALATRRRLRRPLFAFLRAGYRISRLTGRIRRRA